MKNIICITGSVKEEIKGIRDAFNLLRRKDNGGDDNLRLFQGKFKQSDLLLIQTGVGRKNAKYAVDSVVNKFPVQMIISIGFAGGVNKKLSIGDILLCNPVFGYSQGCKLSHYNPDKYLLNKACDISKRNNMRFHTGATLTVDEVVSSVESKQKIERDYKDYSVLAVEMENSAIAEAASSRNIPFLTVRSISDTAYDDISFLDKCQGSFSKLKIGMYAVSHPDIIPGLNRLRKDSQKASAVLTSFIYNFLSETM